MYANRWELRNASQPAQAAQLYVLPAGRDEWQAVTLPPPLLEADGQPTIAVDDNGYLWAAGRGSRHLFRLCPRGPGYTLDSAPAVFLQQQRYSVDISAHEYWLPFDPAALPLGATVSDLESSLQGYCAQAVMSDGRAYEVSIEPGGRSVASPAPAELAGRPRWRSVAARLPCGNHDIT
jgi:hypothetical protein